MPARPLPVPAFWAILAAALAVAAALPPAGRAQEPRTPDAGATARTRSPKAAANFAS